MTAVGIQRARRVLFVQATMAEAYPPIINAAMLLANAGWQVHVLTAPIAAKTMTFPVHRGIAVIEACERPTHVMSKANYARYTWAAVSLARKLRVDVVYASDPLGGGAGLAAARASGARLVYHEHDSPEPGGRSMLSRVRSFAARRADLVVFPNLERARLAAPDIGFSPERLRVVWNVPRRAEVRPAAQRGDEPLIVHYHGTIGPQIVPETVVTAIRRFDGRVVLHLAGYEVVDAAGYIAHLQQLGKHGAGTVVRFLGLFSREQVLAEAAQGHAGLAMMPGKGNVNMRNMTGASNKVFDYMAVGAVPIVSDLPDWQQMFVEPGHALVCDPTNVDSISGVIAGLLANPQKRRQMSERNRAKIDQDWNYDAQFKPVLQTMQSWVSA